MFSLAAAVKAAVPARIASRAFSSTVPVNQICRCMSLRVDGEESAAKVDTETEALAGKLKAKMGEGYAGYTRMLCKTHWDYRVYHVFANADAFKRAMKEDSPESDDFNMASRRIAVLAKKHDVFFQNFVFDSKLVDAATPEKDAA